MSLDASVAMRVTPFRFIVAALVVVVFVSKVRFAPTEEEVYNKCRKNVEQLQCQ